MCLVLSNLNLILLELFRMFTEVYGVTSIGLGVAGIISPLFIYFVGYLNLDGGTDIHFLIVYLTGTVFSVVSYFTCHFMNYENIKY
jgi:hypothetical protein